MKAIEFVTKIENGTIKVPQKYLGVLGKEFRVILLVDEGLVQIVQKKEKSASKKNKKTMFQVKTKDLVFDRNEANKR